MARQRTRTADELTVALNGSPQFLGVIVATTTKNNHTTAAPFSDPSTGLDSSLAGRLLLIQSDTDCYILCGTTNAAAVTTANGVEIFAGEKVILAPLTNEGWLAALAVAGTANVKVWELK